MDYTSKSQLARVSTESWVAQHGYCLACHNDRILQTKTNTQARDFECPSCRHPYELKSSAKPFGLKVVDGAYASMMRRIADGSVPSFLLLQYFSESTPVALTAIHRSLITKEVIQQRTPLSLTARRAGWVGCNLLLSQIPPEGQIPLIRAGIAVPREESRSIFRATERLSTETLASRSWSRAVLSCLHRLPNDQFTLQEAYSFEDELSLLYPQNRNIRPKIRQQLQVLRDAGLIDFEERGVYTLRYKADETKKVSL
jgi:type II restriction enzyme